MVLFDALRGLFDPLLVRRGAAAGVWVVLSYARAAPWVGCGARSCFRLVVLLANWQIYGV